MAEGGGGGLRLRPPSNFLLSVASTNLSETSRSWTNWLEQFEYYMVASEKNEKDEEIQVATLLTILGAEGQELFRTFDLSDADKKKIGLVKKAFTDYFSPRVREVQVL